VIGKPFDVVLGEDVAETVSVFRYYAGWADKIYGQTIDVGNAKLAYTKHEPLGTYASWENLEETCQRKFRRVWSDHSLELPCDGMCLYLKLGDNKRLIQVHLDGGLETGTWCDF
jgi:hypothetical protein